jgi:hypothetical protein
MPQEGTATMPGFPKLDPREEYFRIAGRHPKLKLFLRRLPALHPVGADRRPVLYVHSATFPSEAMRAALYYEANAFLLGED